MLVGYVKLWMGGSLAQGTGCGNSHEKASDGTGEGHFLPVLLSFDPPSTTGLLQVKRCSYLSL